MAVNHEARALLRDARCAVREGGVGDNASRVSGNRSVNTDTASENLPAFEGETRRAYRTPRT